MCVSLELSHLIYGKRSGSGAVVICYEASPTGNCLYGPVQAFGFECCMVAPRQNGEDHPSNRLFKYFFSQHLLRVATNRV